MNSSKIKKIVIVGGGTAGWMCASLMAKQWQQQVEIILIESDSIGTIGVGEGTTPTIKHFFERLNISEQEWMPQCSATYKTGIQFDGWSSIENYESYFHPFYSPLDNTYQHEFKQNCFLKRKGIDVQAHPDKFIVAAELGKHHKAPISPENLPFKMTYAYHFDAGLLAKFLKTKAQAWGVKHLIGTIEQVGKTTDNNLSHVILAGGEKINADFFVDCSGFTSLLLGKTLEVPYLSFSDTLLNDAAVTIRTTISESIPCVTTSTALSCGWAWQIPLTNRFGNGYVYSSKHISDADAEKELRAHLGLAADEGEANHLKMRVGRFSKGWQNNCLAIGLAQGFIEPLEATALHFVSQSIIDFVDLADSLVFQTADIEAYNKKLTTRYNAVKDYIELHYLTNSRNDTPYWQATRSHKPSAAVINILQTWYAGEDIFEQINASHLFEAISWQAMLAGVGAFPTSDKKPEVLPPNLKVDMDKLKRYIDKTCQYFPHHNQALSELK
ncbi:MAG: tryptophan halogenase family protein [Thalassotalea sp.]